MRSLDDAWGDVQGMDNAGAATPQFSGAYPAYPQMRPDQVYSAGRPAVTDIPQPGDFSGPINSRAPELGLQDRIRNLFFSGGAGDLRNAAAGMAPAGLSLALARAANPTAQVLQRGGADLAEQMFDMARRPPLMAAGGGAAGVGAAGAAAAGEQPQRVPLQFSPEVWERWRMMQEQQAAQRKAQEEAAQRAEAERVQRGLQNWIPQRAGVGGGGR